MDFGAEINQIKQRNARVEADKQWEVSWTRRLFITAATYVIAAVWLWLIHEHLFALKALVPAAGYLLSTFSLPALKKVWMKKNL